MTPENLNRALRGFSQTDPRAAANAEHASVLAATLAVEVGIDPLHARHAALAAFGVVPPTVEEGPRRLAAIACDAVLGLELDEEWRAVLERVRDKITPLGDEKHR